MKPDSKNNVDQLTQAALVQKVGAICSIVNQVISPTDLLEQSLKLTLDLFGAGRGSIFIVKENSTELTLKASQGMQSDERQNITKRLGEGVVGKVAQIKEPIFVDDISTDTRFANYKSRKSYSTPSFICAPLLIKDVLIGVINISDKESGTHFTEDEMQLLDFLATQIALNFRRIQLYQKFKGIIKETKTLKDQLGQSDKVAQHLKKQIFIHEKLATIGKLAGGIAHEFNNPLDGVMRYTNLCLESIDDDDIVRGYLLEIKHGLNRMANIVKNLLACSRNEYSVQQKVDFNQVLDHSLAGEHAKIAKKNIKISKEVKKDMPPVLDLGLEGIITNLIRNAIDAMEQDGKITVKADFKDNALNLNVSDTGCGIPTNDVGQIFEPFYTTKDIDKGCGLGLTIVGEIVKSYNGSINVESELKKGTTFSIKLPM